MQKQLLRYLNMRNAAKLSKNFHIEDMVATGSMVMKAHTNRNSHPLKLWITDSIGIPNEIGHDRITIRHGSKHDHGSFKQLVQHFDAHLKNDDNIKAIRQMFAEQFGHSIAK